MDSNNTDNKSSQKRQVAYKLNISHILNNSYFKEEGWQPNYIGVGNLKVSRVNIIGVIVGKDQNNNSSILIDDGTGKIPLRFFEMSVEDLDVGNIVMVVGRPREFGSEKYIAPEIIKKVTDPQWVEIRKEELKKLKIDNTLNPANIKTKPIVEEKIENKEKTVEVVAEEEDMTINPLTILINTIKEIDTGNGVSFDELSDKLNADELDQQIRKLLEEGDIFEIKSGKYKVLE